VDFENDRMMFTPDEQRKGGVPASLDADKADALCAQLLKVLSSTKEELWRLQTADDDGLLAWERAQIGPLVAREAVLESLVSQVGIVVVKQEFEYVDVDLNLNPDTDI
jgi:hypothetical protein